MADDDDRPVALDPQARRSARFGRSARFWLRAYPRRWRAARAGELTEVLADLAAPGATRLDARDALDVVRGGWATRWREHPPLRPWLAYRMFDRRLPARYDGWLWDDVTSPLYALWARGLGLVPFLVVYTARGEPVVGVFAAAIFVVGMLAFGRHLRRRAQRRYFPPESSAPRVLGPAGYRLVPRVRVAARPVLGATALIGLTAAVSLLGACAVATAGRHEHWFATSSLEIPQRGYPTALLVALGAGAAVLGVGVAAALLRGLSQRAQHRPDQPHRVLVGGGPRFRRSAAATVAVTVAFAVLIGADLWVDVTGVVAGTAGSLLGSAAFVGWVRVARLEHEGGPRLALRDVAHLAGWRRRRPLEAEPLARVWTWPGGPADPYAPPATPRPC